MALSIGIRLEDKNRWESRTPIVPDDAAALIAQQGLRVLVQPSGQRIFSDERYRAEPLDSGIYDAALEQRVIEFQRDHRLDVDGLVGQQTQIIINSLLGSEDTPRLTTPRLARE